jgi:hypothetical protein
MATNDYTRQQTQQAWVDANHHIRMIDYTRPGNTIGAIGAGLGAIGDTVTWNEPNEPNEPQQLYTTTTGYDVTRMGQTVTIDLVEDYAAMVVAKRAKESTFMGWLEAKYA